jgi:hypothetical protein
MRIGWFIPARGLRKLVPSLVVVGVALGSSLAAYSVLASGFEVYGTDD